MSFFFILFRKWIYLHAIFSWFATFLVGISFSCCDGELCGALVLVLKLCGYSLNSPLLFFLFSKSILCSFSWYAYKKLRLFFFFSQPFWSVSHRFVCVCVHVFYMNTRFLWVKIQFILLNAIMNIFELIPLVKYYGIVN